MMNIKRNVPFEIQGHTYDIKFPTVRQYILIEENKIILAKGSYKDMILSGTVGASRALDLIDTIAVLSVLCPELISSLKVVSLLDLSIDDMADIVEAYKNQIASWIDSWMDVFGNPKGESNGEGNNKS